MIPIKQVWSLDLLDGTPESPEEHCQKSRGTLRSRQKRKIAPCTPNELKTNPDKLHWFQSHQAFPIPHGSGLTSFRQLQRIPENNVLSLEEHHVQHSNSRKAPGTPNHLVMRADSWFEFKRYANFKQAQSTDSMQSLSSYQRYFSQN